MDAELREVRDFLARHAPFNGLPRGELDELPNRFLMRYHRRGTELMRLGQANTSLFVLRTGACDIVDATGELVERVEAGGSFGASSALAQAPSRYTITTIEDSLVLVAPGPVLNDLVSRHESVRMYYDETSSRRLRHAAELVARASSGAAWLRTPLSRLVSGQQLVTAGPKTSIREAARIMTAARVSALLVTEGTALVGIVTDRDLRAKVIAADVDAAAPLDQIMTAAPRTIGPDSLAFEALLEMTAHGVHHLPVIAQGTDGPRPLGIVTQGDLLRLEKANPVYLVRDIARRGSVDEVAAVTRQAPQLVRQMLGQDASASDITRLLTAIADAALVRLVQLARADLAARGLGDDPGGWCWLALGSQARLELGPSSDQDHAIICSDGLGTRAQDWLEELARFVTEALAQCGYRRCDGDVMASNPRWRAPLGTWQRTFATWVDEPDPDAVLAAQIFFDARVVHGEQSLLDDLRREVIPRAARSRRFLAHLAAQAVSRQPPLGFFKGFVLEKKGEHRDELDIKAGGVHAIIELTRVHALAHSIDEVGTVERLRELGRRGALGQRSVDDLVDAFEFVSHVRLAHQARQLASGEPVDNFVAPSSLSNFDKRHLRDAFEVIRTAQEGLAHAHQTHLLR